MKELSIEEKAKAYDEALKVLHKYDGANIMFTQDLKEEMFPELKENYSSELKESERIRKVLVDYFKSYKEQEECGIKTFYGIPTDNIIAWLEKQGEQKPVIEMKTPEESLGIDSDTYNKIVDECVYGEQNPGAWSKEDEVKINRIVASLENLNVADNDILLKDVAWLKSLRPQNTWRPSDEQIGVIEAVINNRSFQRRHLDSLYEQLKKLREA